MEFFTVASSNSLYKINKRNANHNKLAKLNLAPFFKIQYAHGSNIAQRITAEATEEVSKKNKKGANNA
jgi:hypothetical protein